MRYSAATGVSVCHSSDARREKRKLRFRAGNLMFAVAVEKKKKKKEKERKEKSPGGLRRGYFCPLAHGYYTRSACDIRYINGNRNEPHLLAGCDALYRRPGAVTRIAILQCGKTHRVTNIG